MLEVRPSLRLLLLVYSIAGCASKTSPAPMGPTCNRLQGEASAAILDAAGSVQQCTTTADCKPLDGAIAGTECTDCLYLVGGPQVSAAINARDTAINQICADFKAAGCKIIASGCPGTPGWKCVQGKCKVDQTTTSASDTDAAASLTCAWPAIYDEVPDAAIGACRATRHYLACDGGSNTKVLCPSNDAATCQHPLPGATYSNCQDQCMPGEYALSCGAVGGGPWPQPPSTCRLLPPNPGGGSVACCPCGS